MTGRTANAPGRTPFVREVPDEQFEPALNEGDKAFVQVAGDRAGFRNRMPSHICRCPSFGRCLPLTRPPKSPRQTPRRYSHRTPAAPSRAGIHLPC